MEDQELFEILNARNPWWKTEKVPEALAPQKSRPELQDLVKELAEKRITVIYGPRRVGKSTLMYQLISNLLKSGTDPKRAIYVSMDDPAFEFGEGNMLQRILDVYQKMVIQKEMEPSENVFFFIDEVQYLEGWEKSLKKYFDMRLPVKFVVSGSSALLLQKGLKEFLVGRSLEFEIPPLTFFGFLKLKSDSITELEETLAEARKNMFDVKKLYEILKSRMLEITRHQLFLELSLAEYVRKGGFPESFDTPDMTRWYDKLVSDVLKKIIYRDIVESYGIKAPKNVERLLLFLAENEAQTFSHISISRNMGIDKESLSNYLAYLENAFIISGASLYARSMEKMVRSNKKFYITDPGIRNALLLDFDVMSKPRSGSVLESIVHNHLKLVAETVYYWRAQNTEVDVIVKHRDKLVPIEVKYRNRIDGHDFEGLNRFSGEFNTKYSMMVTKNTFELRGNTLLIPMWLFLVLV